MGGLRIPVGGKICILRKPAAVRPRRATLTASSRCVRHSRRFGGANPWFNSEETHPIEPVYRLRYLNTNALKHTRTSTSWWSAPTE